MSDLSNAFIKLSNALNGHDISFLKQACKAHFDQKDGPCYTLIDNLHTPTFLKIKHLLEEHLKEPLFYLNDFYLYTDNTFGTSWHMDTELFTFESAVNAWILLSPDTVKDPMCFISNLNDSMDRYYHNVEINGDVCTFRNIRDRRKEIRSLNLIEAEKIHTPELRIGDVLVINPRRFHRTNIENPKHCVVIKFVHGSERGFLSKKQVPAILWPEVQIFNDLVKQHDQWEEVVLGIKRTLQSEQGFKALNAGNYPEKIELYKKMVQLL
jgi:hypothetical protein